MRQELFFLRYFFSEARNVSQSRQFDGKKTSRSSVPFLKNVFQFSHTRKSSVSASTECMTNSSKKFSHSPVYCSGILAGMRDTINHLKAMVTQHNSAVWPVSYACSQPYHQDSCLVQSTPLSDSSTLTNVIVAVWIC